MTDKFFYSASAWRAVITSAANWLFWTLGTISLTWTMGMLLLKQADLREFFAEFIRFIIFFGFFLWLLRNGPDFAFSIIQSLIQIGTEAGGHNGANPSAIVDVGIDIFVRTMKHTTLWHPITTIVSYFICLIVLITLALVAANMVVQLCAAWIMLYAGIFFLGFGGSRWTSDMAINYYKGVLGIAASLMTSILIIGVATSLINDYHEQMHQGIELMEMACVMIVSLVLLSLINKVPPMVSGIITGATFTGVGQFNGGTAVAALGAAYTAGRDVLAAGAHNIAGGAQAIQAAYQQAQQHRTQSSGLFKGNDHPAGDTHSFSAAMNRGVSLMADMGKNLAQGVGDVAKNHLAAVQGQFQDRVGETLGGQIATAIHERQLGEQSEASAALDLSIRGSQESPNDSGGQRSDTHPEVQAFMDKSVNTGG